MAISRIKVAFGALVVSQTGHSIEEFVGRLWDSFPPATFLTGLIAEDHDVGFIIINSCLVAFGFWCLLWPVRQEWPTASLFLWFWVVIEMINGVGHLAWSLRQGEYTPGALTAPLLLAVSLYLIVALRHTSRAPPRWA